jgi:chromosome partitioning protein
MAVANQKGGVGKSTTAVSLGAALAEAGHLVLVIDLDPQGNASTGLGIRHEERDVTVYDILAGDADVRRAVVETPVPNLFAIPSTIDLAGAEIELVSQFSREMRLRRALDPVRMGAYDFVLLDCPPSLGLLTINALAAAEELIVPIQCEYYALEGLGQLLRNVRLVQQNVNPGLRLAGIVMTMFDPRTKLSEQVVEEVRKFFGELVYETVIPRTVRLSEAPGFGRPITVYDPRSRGAECYRELAGEVARRPAREGPLPSFEEMPTVVVEPVAPPPPAPRSAPRPLRDSAASASEPEPEPVEPELEPAEPILERSKPGIRRLSLDPREVEEDPGPSAPDLYETGSELPGSEDMKNQMPGPTHDAVLPEAEPIHPRLEAPPQRPADDGLGFEPDAGDERPPGFETQTPRASDAPPKGDHEVVVIDAYDLDPDAGSEPEVEGNGSTRDDEGEGRKRWSLFRRGGKR